MAGCANFATSSVDFYLEEEAFDQNIHIILMNFSVGPLDYS